MEEKNELNDIILNKGSGVSGNKKIILVIATLGIILIIVVMLMNSITSKGTDNLPQAVLPPEPQNISAEPVQDEPLFEDVVVEEENKKDTENLNDIAQRLKKESQQQVVTKEKVPSVKPKAEKKTAHKPAQIKQVQTKTVESTSDKSYFIQVGSFSRYEPDAKFLKSIIDKGFKYQYYKITVKAKIVNKVLVGPFNSEKDARNALRTIRSSIESGAFLVKI